MKVTPGIRRAAHQAIDIFLDALNEPAAVEPKKRRGQCLPHLPALLPPMTPEEQAQIERQLAKAGYVKR